MSISATMRALQQTSQKGPRDVRLITDAPVPSPGQDEVLVRVAAAGVNFADVSRAYGTFVGGPRPPYLAGFEAAGEVVAVGEAVTEPQPGDRVVGVGYGAFAEYMVLPAAAAMPVPAGWTDQQALGLVELADRTCRAEAPGQPAAVVYHGDMNGRLRAHGIVVLARTTTGVSRVVEFHDPVVVMFGFPDLLAG